MSTYYNYYLGFINKKDNKIYPLGPYDNEGILHYAYCTSYSSPSGLYMGFEKMRKEDMSLALKAEFDIKDNKLEDQYYQLYALSYSELPKDDYIKKGYFLIDDIERYERRKEEEKTFDGFWDYLTPTAYAKKCENEMRFGTPKSRRDELGEEYTPHCCADYAYYCYPDYDCEEYEAFLIRRAAKMLLPYYDLEEDKELVVIMDIS